MKEYFRLSRTATYGFLAALPLIIGYEFFLFLGRSQMRVAADVWMKRILAPIGIFGHLAIGLVVLLVGLIVILAEQKKEIKLKPEYFGGILAESLLWAPLFAVTVGWLTVKALSPAMTWTTASVMNANAFTKIGLSLGAGVYEELVFRVFLVSGLAAIGRYAFPERQKLVYGVVAVVAAMVFSLCHYIGPEEFAIVSFIYRFIGGLLLNLLYITRGFGVAAWTHAWYDIMVLLHAG